MKESSGNGTLDTDAKNARVERGLACVAYIGFFVVPLLVSIVIYLAVRRRNRFVQFHAAQAFNAQASCLLITAGILGVAYVVNLTGLFFSIIIAFMAMAVEFCFVVITLFAAIDAARGMAVQVPRWFRLKIIR